MDRVVSFPWEDGDEIKEGQRVAQIRSVGLSKGLQGMSAQLDGLDAQIKNTRAEVERSRQLLNRGVLTQSQFDQIKTGLDAAEANRRALAANRGQLAVNAGNAFIRAPISGIIANKSVEEGDTAVPQMPLCRIIAVDRLKATLRMVESEVPKVKVGQKVKLHVDAYPGRSFEGAVTNIMPFLDAVTRTNTVEVMIDNPKNPETDVRPLKPGMYGRAELVVGMRKEVLVAPEPALLLDNRLLDKQKPGARTGSSYEVLEGLEEGELLIVRGQHGLKDGELVEIVDQGANEEVNS
jgi:membrane fusion protein (multidrug efflux system)